MARRISIVLCVALGVSACGGSSSGVDTAATTTSFVPGTLAAEFIRAYDADDLGFAADFPADWRVEDESDLGVVSFIAPQVPGDTFIENFTVAVTPVPADAPLEEIARRDAQRLQASVGDYRVVGSGTAELGGAPAVSVVYEGSIEGVSLSFFHILALRDAKAYEFTFSASAEEFDNFLPVIEQLLAGFRFTR